jgi:predicted glycoside hydrolase/deacetylase ChbG (UPF0249 family)
MSEALAAAVACAPSQRRRIWLCADDYGISPSVNAAIRDLVARGRLNATSVLVTAPSFRRSEAVALSSLNCASRRVAIGLHVALTAPLRPVSGRFAPLADGAFIPLAMTARHALMRRFDMRALRDEIARQMQGFIGMFGGTPDFIDGHHHVHLFPQIRDAVLQVAKEAAPKAWLRQCGRAGNLSPAKLADVKGLIIDWLSRDFRQRAAAFGLHTNPAFAGTYNFSPATDFAALFPRFLDALPDGGVIMCHPGFVDAELERLDPLTALREREYAFFVSDAFPRVLASRGFALA